MTLIAPTLQAFFLERLIAERNSSPETIGAYRDTLRLLLSFAQQKTGKQPFQLDFDDLDAPLIGAFLTHLEAERGNGPRTRNARLAAIHSLYRFAALRHPEHAATIARVIAIPTKRYERNIVSYLAPRRSRRCSKRPTATAGSAAETAHSSLSRSRPGCASPSSSDCGSATRASPPALTSSPAAKQENNAPPP